MAKGMRQAGLRMAKHMFSLKICTTLLRAVISFSAERTSKPWFITKWLTSEKHHPFTIILQLDGFHPSDLESMV
jgi:tRNA A37 threonylcarbamoyladenosine synthetase subunit TsaC/SUA5/YrdC